MKALLLFNTKARQARLLSLDQVHNALTSFGIELVEHDYRTPEVWQNLIEFYRSQIDAVIVAGGDGSINAVVDALVHSELPMGLLPIGTANDFARTLSIPEDLEAASAIIAKGKTKLVDLGSANGKHFINAASLGLAVAVTQNLDSRTKHRWGKLAYPATVAKTLWKVRPFSAQIKTPDEAFRVRTLQIVIGNGRHYGGGMTVDESASLNDGTLHLFSVEVDSWWQIAHHALAIRRGQMQALEKIRTLQGSTFEISTRLPMPISMDGEITTRTPVEFKVVPRSLKVLVP